MTDGVGRAVSERVLEEDGGMRSLAGQVLLRLAERLPAKVSEIDERLVRKLCDAAQAFDAECQLAVLDEMRAGGISDTEIAEIYIPIAARRLGAAWCEDEVSFADVTIGTARLQAMLRELAPPDEGTGAEAVGSPVVLMVVPQDEYHTLGAVVAARQLRRLGTLVRLSLGQRRALLLDIVESCRFDVIMLSVSSGKNLDPIRQLIVDVRHALPVATPVVIGGVVLDEAHDVKMQTGADHAVNDPKEALRLCGLKISLQGARLRAIRT